MSKAARKPASVEQPTSAADPLIGKTVRVLRGVNAGKVGIARRCYRGSCHNPDRVHIEEPGGAPGWYVAVPVPDVEVIR